MKTCRKTFNTKSIMTAMLISIAFVVVSFIGIVGFGIKGGDSLSVAYADALGSWTDEGNYDTSWYTEHRYNYVYVINDTLDENGDVLISAEQKFAGLAVLVNNGNKFTGKRITLGRDLDLGAYTWTPIGKSGSACFSGDFDGHCHTISNVTISANVNAGLFGYVKDAVFEDVNVDANVTCTINQSGSGVFIGWSDGSLSIDNVHVSGSVTAIAGDKSRAGGIVGYANGKDYGSVVLMNSSNSATVRGRGYAGGVLGSGEKALYLIIVNCSNAGSVTSTNQPAGGLTGYGCGVMTYVVNSNNIGDITCTGQHVAAGIMGGHWHNMSVVNSFTTGTLTSPRGRSAISGYKQQDGEVPVITNFFYPTGSADYLVNLYNPTIYKPNNPSTLTDQSSYQAEGAAQAVMEVTTDIVSDLNDYISQHEIIELGNEEFSLCPIETDDGGHPVLSAPVTISYEVDSESDWKDSKPLISTKSGKGVTTTLANADNVEVLEADKKFFAWTNGEDDYAPGAMVTLDENVTLTAKLIDESDCMLYYEAGAKGVTGTAPSPAYTEEGNSIVLQENTFKRDGYRFEGWAVKPSEGEALTDNLMIYLPGYSYPVSEDVVMIAIWSDKPTLVIDPDIYGGTLSVTYDDGEELAYTTVNNEIVYYLDIGRTVYITATPASSEYKLLALRYKKDNGSYIVIPTEDGVGALMIADGFKGVYTVSASFVLNESSNPTVAVNKEVWYGSVTTGGTTINNCSIVYVKVQLPLGVDYSNMKIKFVLTRNQVWAADKKKEYTVNLNASDFDESGFYTAGVAIRRRDLENADGVTADGYIMNAQFIFTEAGIEKTVSTGSGVEFACGKQSLKLKDTVVDGIVTVDKFDGENVTFDASQVITSSGIKTSAIKYTSSDINVATVNSNGTVTVLKQGREVAIKAYAGEHNATLVIKSMGMSFTDGTDAIESVAVNYDSAKTAEEQTGISVVPTAINLGNYEMSGATFNFSIANSSVATISTTSGASVTVKPVSSGVTTLTVTANLTDGVNNRTLTVIVPVYVTDNGVTSIVSESEVAIGSKRVLTVASSNTEIDGYEWQVVSGDAYIESNVNGKTGTVITITGRATGAVTIAAVGKNGSGTAIAVATKRITVTA